jgi:hypothetical protein
MNGLHNYRGIVRENKVTKNETGRFGVFYACFVDSSVWPRFFSELSVLT